MRTSADAKPAAACDPLRGRWRILALLVVCRTALGVQFQTLGSVSPELAADLGLSLAEIGSLIGLFMLPGVALAYPAGLAGRRCSDRALVSLGLGAMAVGGLLCAQAGSYQALAAGRLMCGSGFVFATLFFTKMAADWFAGREIATAMGLLVMTWPMGIAIGQIAHVWLQQMGGRQLPFGAASAACALASLALWLCYRAPAGGTAVTVAAPAGLEQRARTGAGLTTREWALTLTASLAWALFNAGYVLFVSFAPGALAAQGLGLGEAATWISLASWVMIVSIAACGQLADRSGAPDRILYVCMATATVCMLVVPTGTAPWVVSLAFGLVGAAPAGVIMALTGQALTPAHRALGMGVFLTSYYLVVAPAPLLAGWLLDRPGASAAEPLHLAGLLFALTAMANAGFRLLQRRLPG